MAIEIDGQALETMQSLLAEQFDDTLEFCFSELERLHQAFVDSVAAGDTNEAIRHIHSLKSNAAQFGAMTLAATAKDIEHAFTQSQAAQAEPAMARLAHEISHSIAAMRQWHAES